MLSYLRFLLFAFWAMCVAFPKVTNALDIDLFINKGSVSVDENEFAMSAFNSSPDLSTRNSIIRLDLEDELNLNVTNNDTLVHSFQIDGVIDSDNLIQPGESTQFSLTFDNAGTYRYYSDFSYGALAGASGIILVGYPEYNAFYWNLFDLNKELSIALAANETNSYPLEYQPELFFINGAYFPNTLEDPQTLVDVELNDEVVISVVNSGSMDHVLHFHGFHIEILSAQIQTDRLGWIKDTIPLKSGEAMTFKLVASQEGIYPVHDHNLIAVTNVGFYPGGMLTQIHVGQ